MSRSTGRRIASTVFAAAVLAGGLAAGAGTASATGSDASLEAVDAIFVGSIETGGPVLCAVFGSVGMPCGHAWGGDQG